MLGIRRIILSFAMAGSLHPIMWAQNNEASDRKPPLPTSADATDSQSVGDRKDRVLEKKVRPTDAVDEDSKYELTPGEDPNNHLFVPVAKHLVTDQYAFWTAPVHFKARDLEWGLPLVGVTAGFMAGDSWLSKQIPLREISRSKTISDYGAYS